MWESLLSFSVFSFLLALSPGPDNIYVITQSLSNGFKSGLAVSLGLISGCIVHTTLLAFGVSALIAASEELLWIIKIFGALYLVYLAWKVYRANSEVFLDAANGRYRFGELFKTGIIMNLVNPKVLIFFLAFFPSFLWNTEANTIGQFYVLGLLFMAIALTTFTILAFLAGSISSFLKTHPETGLILKWLQIIVFLGIAVYIFIG